VGEAGPLMSMGKHLSCWLLESSGSGAGKNFCLATEPALHWSVEIRVTWARPLKVRCESFPACCWAEAGKPMVARFSDRNPVF